ncbi:autotransporter domain-containing protein [Govanella unica]|uniref:Autotransporter domain-containing protein n=1 Tax=Govanella unica TaxID=2975056 RepID=A0A9X3TZI2_9PROT|nr:autotransporter domain-containing protein [Govania unica]MDA5194319.1 autotransporter domain-containing protein [Govania unica]
MTTLREKNNLDTHSRRISTAVPVPGDSVSLPRRSGTTLYLTTALVSVLATLCVGPQALAQAYMGNQETNGPFPSGVQDFFGFSKLNASVENAVSGGYQNFYDSSELNASANNTVSGGEQKFYNFSKLNASAENAISGGWQDFWDSSVLNASAKNAVSNGKQGFHDASNLNALVENAVSGGFQSFWDSSAINASVENAISGGTQDFYGNNVLNASAKNAVSGGSQRFLNNGVLNASTGNAVSGGTQGFWTHSTLNASAENSVSGGAQDFKNSSMLNATAKDAVSGGNQTFNDASVLSVYAANAVSGGDQTFNDASALNAYVANAISDGIQAFWSTSVLNASAENAISGGMQYFFDNSQLNASAENAVSGGMQYFHQNSMLLVTADDALTTNTALSFDKSSGGVGGSLVLFGHNTAVGRITSVVTGSGGIFNSGNVDAVLTVDSSLRGDSNFSGIIADVEGTGPGRLGLTKAGWGTLILSGENSYSLVTTILDGTLQLGDGGTSGSIDSDVVNYGVLAFDRSNELNFARVISGSGSVHQIGSGIITLTGDNSYTGGTRIDAGVLRVSRDENLGDASGGLSLDEGTLETTDSFDTSRAVTLTRAGTFYVASGTELGLTGVVSGDGDLVKTGDGTLRLVNFGNSYGDSLVQAGVLIGDVASISGRIGNAATVVFDQAVDASYSREIVGFGGTNGVMIKRGAGNLTLGGNSALNWTIESGGLKTAAERFVGNAAIASGASFTFDQSANASYSGVISGSGDFVKAGRSKLALTGDSSAFAGFTHVSAGLLSVNGKIGGSMSVDNGGIIGGSGTVGAGPNSRITIASGGTLAPGNSIGTLTIDGDLIFNRGALYAVEVDPQGSASDLIKVTGKAILNGGSVVHVGAGGPYNLRSTYRILAAGGGLSGRFDDVTSNFAFLTPELIYDYAGRTIDLALVRNNVSIASKAATVNQIATANAIDSSGISAAHPVFDAVIQLPDDKDLVRTGLDQLSGEIHASTKTVLIEDSRFVRDAATDRIRAALGGVAASSQSVMAHDDSGWQPVAATSERFTMWGQGFGAWGHANSDGNAARLDRSTGGFLLGGDTPVLDNWRLGMIVGISRTSFNVQDRRSSGTSDNYYLGLYGGRQWGSLGFRTGLAYSWNGIKTNRTVSFPGFSDSLKGKYAAGTVQAFGELGSRIDLSDVAFEPFVNLAYISLHTDGFAEQGGAAALHSNQQGIEKTFSTLGLRASTNVDLGDTNLIARGTLGWRHSFGDSTPLATHAFSTNDSFTVAGAPITRNAAVVEAGLDLNLSSTVTLGLSYQGQIASDAEQHGFKVNFSVKY